MGRYYTGQISGKFWFAIQDSDDPSHFGVEPDNIYYFHSCSCYISHEELKPNIYCKSCFSSYEEHIEAMKEDEIEGTETWFKSMGDVNYNFHESDLEKVNRKIIQLEKFVGMHMDSFKIHDESDEIQYSYDLPKDAPEEILSLIARLCIGKQIAYCLKKHGVCSFTAEL